MKYLKQFLIIVQVIILSINVNAQDHCKFMDISISGTFANIKPKLENVGLIFAGKDASSDMYNFTGTVIGKNAFVSVSLTPTSKQVMSIQCSFDKHSTLEDATIEFISIAKSLNIKYGKSQMANNLPSNIVSETVWKTEPGWIVLTLYTNGSCMLSYMDVVNWNLGIKENESIRQSQL